MTLLRPRPSGIGGPLTGPVKKSKESLSGEA